jgi:hypothetical protein
MTACGPASSEYRTMQDGTVDVLKGTPPLTVAAAIYVAGLTVEQWVAILTIAWLLIIIAQHAYDKWLKPFLRRRRSAKLRRSLYDEIEAAKRRIPDDSGEYGDGL